MIAEGHACLSLRSHQSHVDNARRRQDADPLGYDPLNFTQEMSTWDYAGDFSRGVLCGDAKGAWGFCDGDTLAYLSGNIAVGFFGVGDIRDALANVAEGDLVSAGWSAAAIVPIAGDAAGIVRKGKAFLTKIGAKNSVVLRWLMNHSALDTGRKVDLLETTYGKVLVASLQKRGISDENLVRFAQGGMNFKHLDTLLAGAASVRQGQWFRTEASAQAFLFSQIPGAKYEHIIRKPGNPSNVSPLKDSRRVDVYDVAADTGHEVKNGYWPFNSRVAAEIKNDERIINDPDEDMKRAVWHFFPSDTTSKIGPNARLLQELKKNNIPYVMWIP